MDDFILLHHDKNYLKKCKDEVEIYLNNFLKLELSKKKTQIINIKHGFEYLGWNFKVLQNGKIIQRLKQQKKKRVNKRLKALQYDCNQGNITLKQAKNSFQSINGHLKKGNTHNLCKKLYKKFTLQPPHQTSEAQ